MADQWITAAAALNILPNQLAICARCHAGLIRTQAETFDRHGKEERNSELPQQFWWAEGHEALEQNWDIGDFTTWIDHAEHWRAYGVRFALDDLLTLIPFEEQAAARLRLSVAGNAAWVSAREARRFANDEARLQPLTAGSTIIAQCRLGFVSARAVEMLFEAGSKKNAVSIEAREWDVPTWFWDGCTPSGANTHDWEQGIFTANFLRSIGPVLTSLNGVYFLRSSLDVLLPSLGALTSAHEAADSPKPNLPETQLLKWWQRRKSVRDRLSQNDLLALAKADFPEHTVARDRIRALADNRKPGPRTN